MGRVILIGLDAASYNFLEPWMAQAALPHLARLFDRAAHGPLRSTIPPVTSVAWRAMVTGLDSSRLGLYDLVGRTDYGYRFVPATFLSLPRRSLWHLLSARGRRVAVIGVPATYPAERVRGVMLAGEDAPAHDARAWYPADLPEILAEEGLSFPWDVLRKLRTMERRRVVGAHLNEYLDGWRRVIQAKAALARWALHSYEVDFCMVVFSATDHVVHHTDREDAIRRIYTFVDEAVGAILDGLPAAETWIIVASDHGSTRTDFLVSLYRLLYDQGWLTFRAEVAPEHVRWLVDRVLPQGAEMAARAWAGMPRLARRLLSAPFVRLEPRLQSAYSNIDWSRTCVYAPTSHGPLYVNLRGREPQGIVSPGVSYERLRDEVIDVLSKARDPHTNVPLFAWVRRGEEVFPPPHFRPPPDIVFEPADWRYKIVTGFHTHALVRPNRHRAVGYVEHGWHTPWGVCAIVGPGVQSGYLEGMRIVDVAPTVLHLLGEPILDDMEGRVIERAFSAKWQSAHPVQVVRPDEGTPGGGLSAEVDDAEVRLVEDHLRALGYLE